jgi:hypothetical protein
MRCEAARVCWGVRYNAALRPIRPPRYFDDKWRQTLTHSSEVALITAASCRILRSSHDFAADMATMSADPETQRWWAVCMPCQAPLLSRRSGEHWAAMEEVFHCD